MVVTAVGQSIQKVNSIVAGIALLARYDMELRLAHSHDAIVTLAALSKDLLMINCLHGGKIRIGVTALAAIARGDVVRRFADSYYAIMARCTVVNDA